MATIGSITIAFGADLRGLSEGIEESIDLFDDISERIEQLSEELDTLSEKFVIIRTSVDTAEIERAKSKVEELSGSSKKASAKVDVTADTSEISSASSAVEDLGTAIDSAGSQAVQGRSAISSLIVSTARVTATATAASRAYREIRDSTLGYIQASTGAASASQAVGTIQSALRGDVDSLRTVFTATGQAVQQYVSGLFSVEGVSRVLQGAVGSVASAFGIADRAVVDSIAYLSSFITNQVAAAGTYRASQRTLLVLGEAYGKVANSIGSFITTTTTGAAAGQRAADAIGLASRVASRVDAAYSSLIQRVGQLTQRFNIVGPSSAAVGTAFDAIGNSISGLLSGSQTLSSIFSAVTGASTRAAAGLASILPSLGAVGSAISSIAPRALPLVGLFSSLRSAVAIYSSAASDPNVGIPQLQSAVAGSIAANAAVGGVVGAARALAAGASLTSGAVSGMAAAFPLTSTFAIAAAVATGRFADELEHLSLAAQATEQMASRFGSTTQEMTKLRLAAQNTNVSMSQLAKGQQAFYTNLSKIKIGQLNVESVREAKLAYDRLGISIEELKQMKPEEAFRTVAKELSEVKDPADRTRIAFDLFGKQGAAILPALKEFGELEQDFKRLGGALNDLDFERFTTLENSFDRAKAASANLKQALLIPFVELQKALNSVSADIKGGLASALTPVMSILADITKPLAVIAEVAARVINVMLRLVGAIAQVAGATLVFSTVATLAEYAGKVILDLLSYVEALVSVVEQGASAIASAMRPAMEVFETFGEIVIGLIETFTGNIFGNAESSARSTATAIIALGAAYFVATASTQVYTIAMKSAAVQAVASAATTAAAWVAAIAATIIPLFAGAVGAVGAWAASMIAAAATAVATAVVAGAAWLVALGPIGLVILGVAGVGAAFAGLYAAGAGIVDFFSSFDEGRVKIDAATASVEELAAAAEQNAKGGLQKDMEALSASMAPASGSSGTAEVNFGEGAQTAEVEFGKAREALVQFGMSFGVSEEEAAAWAEATANAASTVAASVASTADQIAASLAGPPASEIMASVSEARDNIGSLTIEAARFGQAGADAASQTQQEFNKLQQSLADGDVTLEEFDSAAAKLGEDLQKNLDILKNDSPEITLKKNLELYKQLDDGVKAAGKSIRDLTAVRQVDDKLLPASEEVKRRAAELKNEYAGALEEIKKKQQSGGFQKELTQKKVQLEDDFRARKIDSKQYAAMKLELDSTNAQEEASKAAEEVQREFDRKQAKLKADLSFADDIRKRLDDAFMSPVQKMEKELKKIAENPDLNPSEKASASFMVRKSAREGLVGKDAQSQLTERTRDLTQARDSGLISGDEFGAEMKKAMEDLASAVGVTKTPFEAFSSSLDNIAKQFGFAGQPLDEVRRKLSGNAEQLALFDRALQESRDNLLASLGVEKSPQKVFEDQMKKIDEAANSKDPSKRITADEAAQARAAATRKRDSALGAGEDLGGQFAERQKKINEAFGGGKDPAKLAVANNRLAIDRRQAAGLDATPAQALQAGIDKINDAFGDAGKGTAEYNEAIKKNSEAVKASLGVEKTGAEKIAESRQKLAQAVADGVITQKEADKAIKEQKDSLLSSLGISKSPAQEFEDAVAKIQENAAELSPDEIAKGLKEAKDRLLQSLGIDKTPVQQAAEATKNLTEAFQKGQISAEEFAKGMQKTRDTMLQSLGIPLDPVTQLAEKMTNLQEAMDSGLITQEEFTRGQDEAKKSLLPGGEEESPVKKFQRDLETLQKANSQGLIDDSEFAQRKQNLQAELQESLGPALDNLKPDRRGVEGSDARSKSGVDTFFRILRGNDNPSLKAQLEIARNTKLLAEASRNPEAAPVVAMIGR